MSGSIRAKLRAGKNSGSCRPSFPHENVYVRLGPSAVHGVGVFAIRDIPKGVLVFGEEDEPVIWVPASVVRGLPSSLRVLYEDFGVLRRNKYLCPKSFNGLTVAWYLNHSDKPNVQCNTDYRFVTTRRIRQGEEITADYRTYSDDALPWVRRRTSRIKSTRRSKEFLQRAVKQSP
jgi:hypothetical protein